jgi:hypothetical protein
MENLISYTLSTENNRSRLVDGDLREEDNGGGKISKFRLYRNKIPRGGRKEWWCTNFATGKS